MNITQYIILINILAFLLLDPISQYFSKYSVFCPYLIYDGKNYSSIILSNYYHASFSHIFFNMISLNRFGNKIHRLFNFKDIDYIILIFLLGILSNIINFIISFLFIYVIQYPHFFYSCSLGFSGIIFGLSCIYNKNVNYIADLYGIRIHSSKIIWIELLLTSLLLPNVSFLSHLSGIIAGYLLDKY